MNQKIAGAFLLLLVFCGAAVLLQASLTNNKAGTKVKNSNFVPQGDINLRWKKDIQGLVQKGEIPKAWMSIREVRYIPLDEPLKALVLRLEAPVDIQPNGDFALEVTIMSHVSEQGNTLLIFQHNIIDLENDNTLWELNRTYPLISQAAATN